MLNYKELKHFAILSCSTWQQDDFASYKVAPVGLGCFGCSSVGNKADSVGKQVTLSGGVILTSVIFWTESPCSHKE